MSMSLDAAAEVFRDAMRETVKRYSLWYLIQGVLLVVAGVLAIIYPVISSAAVVVLLGWLLIISGVVQGISLIGAGHVPNFWLQLISVILAMLIGFLFLRDPAQGMADDHAAPDRLLHDRGNFKGRLRADDPAFSELGLGARERPGRNSPVADPVGQPAGDGVMAGRVPARDSI